MPSVRAAGLRDDPGQRRIPRARRRRLSARRQSWRHWLLQSALRPPYQSPPRRSTSPSNQSDAERGSVPTPRRRHAIGASCGGRTPARAAKFGEYRGLVLPRRPSTETFFRSAEVLPDRRRDGRRWKPVERACGARRRSAPILRLCAQGAAVLLPTAGPHRAALYPVAARRRRTSAAVHGDVLSRALPVQRVRRTTRRRRRRISRSLISAPSLWLGPWPSTGPKRPRPDVRAVVARASADCTIRPTELVDAWSRAQGGPVAAAVSRRRRARWKAHSQRRRHPTRPYTVRGV